MKKKLSGLLLVLILCITTAMPVFAEESQPRLVDNADLLTESEKVELNATLDEISSRQEMDVVVVTVYSLDGKTSTEYADDFYDDNGYGFGESYDGILLLISMEDHDWAISTCGEAIEVFTDAGQEYMTDQFISYLSEEEYKTAFTTYADICDEFITQAKTGEPYDSDNLPKEPFAAGKNLVISLIIGLVAAFIVTGIMRSKLKSVRSEAAASNYMKKDSLKVTNSRDMFLYRHVDRREKPKDNSSSGSSVHTSSSGRTHGGSSGKF